jgi:hypothetical protein
MSFFDVLLCLNLKAELDAMPLLSRAAVLMLQPYTACLPLLVARKTMAGMDKVTFPSKVGRWSWGIFHDS